MRMVPVELKVPQKYPSVQELFSNIAKSYKEAHANITKRNAQMAKNANKKRKTHDFKVDNRIQLYTVHLQFDIGSIKRKFFPKYCCPFIILTQIMPVTFRLKLSQPSLDKGVEDSFHTSLLQPFLEDKFGRRSSPQPEKLLDDGSVEYEVENC